ncbi:CBN-ADA-2 protein [Caenorhabditis brenneri]|uniref:CBN-ADA-2 protein n=1 Tax=Caenorhabditis brenneri TaxID=135651 RepID=G0N9B8_CAEBE|nr:CBN-ADA-2 protein [Caenorhabditis brenneri]
MSDDTEEQPTCFNCTLRVDETVHVNCYECDVKICMLCFQCGAESHPHKRGHNYELIKPAKDDDGMTWTYEDEFELLKAAHKFKMGNWGAIAESIGRGRKDGYNCKDYFEKHFVRGWIGQFSIKSCNWAKIKYNMNSNQTLDTVLQKNCQESIERMLMIRDAIRDSGENIDENDPKLASKIQNLLEQYVDKCMNNEVDIKYERPKILTNQYERDLSPDPCDPDDVFDVKARKSVKIEVQTDDSENDESPGPSSSSRRNGPPSAKRRRTSRVVRESSTESDGEEESGASDNETMLNGTKQEMEDDDTTQEPDSETEKEEKKQAKKRGYTPSGRRKKRKLWGNKKDRRLQEFRKMMNREAKRSEVKLATLSNLCSVEEIKELRNSDPSLYFEHNLSKDHPKVKRCMELSLLGYNIEREEFETEWYNEAEQLISRLSITAAPPEKDERLDMENDIKFARLRHYNRLLGMRKAKRNTVIEHDKVNEFIRWYKEACLLSKTESMTEKMDSRSEKEKLLCMAQQFLSREEYRKLRTGIERMDGLRERIEVLQELQRNGDITLKNAPVIRNIKKKMRKIDCVQQKKIHSEWTKTKRWHTDGYE